MFPNMMGDLLKMMVKKVQEKNTKDPNVKTADGSVFENMMDRFQKSRQKAETPTAQPAPAEDFCEDLCNEMDMVQKENEADPNVETADGSVFNDMKAEIEALKKQIAEQKATSAPEVPSPSTYNQMMAMTNSNGGSLALRSAPDMGAAVNTIRIPDSSLLQVIEYSENAIILDGQKSRFVLIEYEGQQGWVLESYLNFN